MCACGVGLIVCIVVVVIVVIAVVVDIVVYTDVGVLCYECCG